MGIVLLSSGLDSVVAASLVKDELKMALTVDYGQKARVVEIQYARKVSELLGLKHVVVKLPWLGVMSPSSLTESENVPVVQENELDDESVTMESMRAVWVPNRNGVMVNIAASYAEAYGYSEVVVGFDREEAGTFPDNSSGFVKAINESLAFSTLNGVKVKAPVIDMTKEEIVENGLEVGAPLEWSWSCYYNEGPCLECESCKRRLRAFGEVRDPLLRRLEWSD